jgi:hypothetical protein
MSKTSQLRVQRLHSIREIGRGKMESNLISYLLLTPKVENWPNSIAKDMSDEKSRFYSGRAVAAYDISQPAESLIRKKLVFCEKVVVGGRPRNLLYLTVRGTAAAMYLEEGFLNGQSEYFAMSLLIDKIQNDLPVGVATFLKRFIAIVDRNSSNIMAHYMSEYFLAENLFDQDGMLDFGGYTDKDFKRMFLSNQVQAEKVPGYKGPDERFSKELDKLVQDSHLIATLGLTEEDLDHGFEQVREQYLQLKKQLKMPSTTRSFAAS